MGRSLAPVSRVAPGQRYDKSAHNPFEALGFSYLVEPRPDGVLHREVIRGPDGSVASETVTEVHFAIGSGSHAYSYLVDRGGYLFQSPITWYTQKGFWGLSPGFEDRHDRFARPITAECLFCHTNQVHHVEHTANRYHEPIFASHAIGCERCHGPGQLHVARREHGELIDGIDDSIVNPKHLASHLRDSVCEQCHLEAEVRVVRRGRDVFDYRPGLPLHLFWSIFVRRPDLADIDTVVSHVEQMHESACYQKSSGKMSCISCHDPHEQPILADRPAYYRSRCLECHADSSCTLPLAQRQEKQDACATCHMPASTSSDVAHVAVTDHRVPRHSRSERSPHGPARSAPDEWPLVHYHRHLVEPDDPEVARDLGIALADVVRKSRGQAPVANLAVPLLDAAVARAPDDVEAAEARAYALSAAGHRASALEACEALLTHVPKREVALADAATLAQELGQADKALAWWRRAVEVNPWMPRYRFHLAQALAASGDWLAAVKECEALLAFDPANAETRLLLVAYHLEKGDRERARAEFDRALALKPDDPQRLRRWFEAKMRGGR
jgi:tetratricopeptide (TPR) repeat protein